MGLVLTNYLNLILSGGGVEAERRREARETTWAVFSEGCHWITCDELGRKRCRVTSTRKHYWNMYPATKNTVCIR
jgi:hypothetical protein